MDKITVEIVFALPDRQKLIAMTVDQGTTAGELCQLSNIQFYFPNNQLSQLTFGIFSQPCREDYILQNNDRLEIYRPLICDPKEMRRKRAKKYKT